MKAVAQDAQPQNGSSRKLFYRIHEVAKMTGLKPYVLRYWESEFKELAPEKDASEQRRYRPSDIEVVQAIRKLLYDDRFTIQGARKRLRNELRRMRGEAVEPEEEAAETDGTEPRSAAPDAAAPKAAAPKAADAGAPPPQFGATLRRLRLDVSELIDMLDP